MSVHGPTIVARPVAPGPRRKPPQLTQEKRLELAQKRKTNKESVEAAIKQWFDECTTFAESLHDRFPGKSADTYLNQMFSGALRIRKARQPNVYNAWLHHMAQKKEGVDAVALGEENIEDYYRLSDGEKEKLVAALADDKLSNQFGLRLDKRSRIQDINSVCKRIEDLLAGLRARAGIEGFYCVVRNNPDYEMTPRWFFTNDELDEYLRATVRKFVPERIGIVAEAFAISGSDFFSQLKNSKEKIAWLKGEIRELVQEGLTEATGNAALKMSYVNFTRDIEIPYKVTMNGWAGTDKENPRPWLNPSQLPNDMELLKSLRTDLQTGTICFAYLTTAQHEATKTAYEALMANTDTAPPRKKRKDAGTKRKKPARNTEADEADEGGPDASKRPRREDGSEPDGAAPAGTA